MTHDSILFNLHDLTLLFAVSQYFLLSIFLFLTRKHGDQSSVFLILILLFNAFESIGVFMIWSEPIRLFILNWQPNFLFWGGLGFWLQGPLLYWYVSSVLYKDFKFTVLQLVHLVPATVVLILLYWNYYSLPRVEQLGLMTNLEFVFGKLMGKLVTYRYLSVISYGIWCFYTLYQYRTQVRQQYAGYGASERKWLRWVIIGIVTISTWNLFVHQIGIKISPDASNIMGLLGNYFTFIFVNSLVFLSIRYAPSFEGLSPKLKTDVDLHSKKKTFNSENIERIEMYMRQKKPYLNNDIHIEELAKKISLPVRTLSNIINQHFNKNFFEFINTYRIDEAKRLLTAPESSNKTVLEIIHETGFGSKSSFNTVFKQYVNMTPSEFRINNSNK